MGYAEYVAPLITLLRKELPPEGKPWNKATIFASFCGKQNEARGRLKYG